MTSADVGARIRRYREQHGIPIKALAIDLGVHQSSVSAWETGERGMTLERFLEICEAMHVKPEVLLHE